MNIGETTLSFLQEDCVREFGEKDGERLFRLAEQEYQKLLCAADYRNSGAVREHLQKKLFPPMAYYKALCAAGYAKEAALDCVRKETRKAAQAKQDEMRGLAQMPFAYSIYRMGVKKHMKKNFPDAGWETEWVCCNSREIHFNLRRCIYWDLARQYGCPELCCVYCQNDEVAFSGLLPKIRFERAGTLGGGAACCDFHFIKA